MLITGTSSSAIGNLQTRHRQICCQVDRRHCHEGGQRLHPHDVDDRAEGSTAVLRCRLPVRLSSHVKSLEDHMLWAGRDPNAQSPVMDSFCADPSAAGRRPWYQWNQMVIGAVGALTVNSLDLLAKRASVQGWYSGTAVDSEDTLLFSQLNDIASMNEIFSARRSPGRL